MNYKRYRSPGKYGATEIPKNIWGAGKVDENHVERLEADLRTIPGPDDAPDGCSLLVGFALVLAAVGVALMLAGLYLR